MEDDLNMDDAATENAAALGSLDPQAQLAALFARYPALEQERKAERERIKAAKAARFEAARADIEQRRFGAPTTSQQLYALSAALLSPRTQPGIAGTLGNLVPTLSQMSQLQSSADAQRSEALRQLREQYEVSEEDAVLKALEEESKAVAEQMRILGPLAKPRVPRPVGVQKIGENVVAVSQDPDTGEFSQTVLGKAPEGPKTPIQVPGVTSGGQPVFRVGEQLQLADGTPVTRFDPKETKPRAPSAAETRQIILTEDLVNNRLAAIRSMQEALSLNQQAYDGSISGVRMTLGRLFASDDPTYVASEQLENLVRTGGLSNLKAMFGANPTEGERKAAEALQAGLDKPRAVREKLLRRLLEEMQIALRDQTQRLEGLKTGQYGQYQQPSAAPAPAPARGKPRVINWGN